MKHYFDEIFVLNLASRQDRLEHFKSEMNKVGLDFTTIYTTKKPFYPRLVNDTFLHNSLYTYWQEQQSKFNRYLYASVYDCAMKHYEIIKTSYERGLNNILILEDDIEFISDNEYIESVFNCLPEDYTILKYYGTFLNNDSSKELFYKIPQEQYDSFAQSTACYAVSRKGMKEIIDTIDNMNTLVTADLLFNYLNKETIYTTNKQICKIHDSLGSNIVNF